MTANIGHNQFSSNSLSNEDRKKVKQSVNVIVDSLTQIAAQQDLIKGEAEALFKTLGIPTKLAKRLARAKFRASFDQDSEEFETFQHMFETVVK